MLRTLFIVLLLVLTGRVSMPESETIWTAYDTPADLVRLTWVSASAPGSCTSSFRSRKDAGSPRTWFYLGLVAVPFSLIVLFAVW